MTVFSLKRTDACIGSETPIYAILIWNIIQALYAMYINATATQLLKLDENRNAAPSPLAAPAPGLNPSTRVRASLVSSSIPTVW